MPSTTPHPFYPASLVFPTYVANTLPFTTILFQFFTLASAILLASYFLIHQKLSSEHRFAKKASDTGLFLWFILCGFIHTFFEGYFGVFHETMVSDNSLFGQMWKEYAMSDSRYLSSDSFVLIMERITAFAWGPLSFFTAYAIYSNSPHRHIAQLLVSLGQLYGDILYYLTTYVEGFPHSRPEGFYFWFYFVLLNAFWIVIPLFGICQSWRRLAEFASTAKLSEMKAKKK